MDNSDAGDDDNAVVEDNSCNRSGDRHGDDDGYMCTRSVIRFTESDFFSPTGP